MKGGKAIASGSYGCVFKPALSCDGRELSGLSGIRYVWISWNHWALAGLWSYL